MSVDAIRYVGRKTLRKLQGRSNEQFTAAPSRESFGRAMMERMGWSEGKGVGKHEDGMTEHIRAKKRGAEGLGADRETASTRATTRRAASRTGGT